MKLFNKSVLSNRIIYTHIFSSRLVKGYNTSLEYFIT